MNSVYVDGPFPPIWEMAIYVHLLASQAKTQTQFEIQIN